MPVKTESSYSLSGNNAFLDYLRRYRTADICAQFFRGIVGSKLAKPVGILRTILLQYGGFRLC